MVYPPLPSAISQSIPSSSARPIILVKSAEKAFDLLQLLNTGHSGVSRRPCTSAKQPLLGSRVACCECVDLPTRD